MRVPLLFMVLATFAGSAMAQSIAIRTGEHAGFTRLVLRAPDLGAWSIGRTGPNYLVRFDSGLKFDLSGAFDRIPKSRVVELTDHGRGQLEISLGCDCHVEPFVWQDTALVVDVVDGAPFERRYESRVSLEIEAPQDIAPRIELPLLFAPGQTATVLNFTPDSLDTGQRSQILAQVAQGIAAGAGQGLLQIVTPDRSQERRSGSMLPVSPIDISGAGIATYTSLEAALLGGEVDSPDDGRANCVATEYLDVKAWSDGTPLGQQIATLVSSLENDRSEISAPTARALARLYIAHGFGKEARQMIQIAGLTGDEAAILEELAAYVDGETAEQALLPIQATCSEEGALWSLLTAPDPPPNTDSAAVQRTFQSLPRDLQILLAPRLSERLLTAGQEQAASDVLSFAGSRTADLPPTFQIEEARILQATEQVTQAFEKMDKIVHSGEPYDPQVLVDYFRLAHDTGADIGDDVLEVSATFRKEIGAGDLWHQLLVAEIAATLDRGSYLQALELVSGTKADLGGASYVDALNGIAVHVAEFGTDADVLVLSQALDGKVLGVDARIALSGRLEAIGLAQSPEPSALDAQDTNSGIAHQIQSDAAASHPPESGAETGTISSAEALIAAAAQDRDAATLLLSQAQSF